ncbi:hypothetical protein HK101_008901 [Irineochytrium annulatum]|nr:hypothetical protein HK101_008901 [Irineochytrium annulatum]
MGSTLFTGWTNSTGGVLITQRVGITEVQPLPTTATPIFTQAAVPKSLILSTSQISYALTVPMSQFSMTGPTSMLWAYSASPPLNPNSPSSSFFAHDDRSAFNLNIFPSGSIAATATATAVIATLTAPAAPIATNGISTSRFCVDSSNSVCVSAYRDLSTSSVNFTIQSTRSGWVGIGVGASQMSGATMYVAWPSGISTSITASSGDDTITAGQNLGGVLSQRYASGHNQPAYTTPQQFTTVPRPSNLVTVVGATLTVSFSCSDALVSRTGATSFIYAFSDFPPDNPSDPTSGFRQHGGGDRGAFSMDLSKAGASTASSTSTGISADTLRKAHGAVMLVGWGVLPAIGIFIAKFMKERLGHMWYILHSWIMQGGVVLCSAAGLALIEVEISPGPRFQPNHPHKILGCILVFGILPAQIILGQVANKMYKADRVTIPWWDQAHWWLGRLAVLQGVVTIFLGIWLYNVSTTVLFACFAGWMGLVVIAFGLGGKLTGAGHHETITHAKVGSEDGGGGSKNKGIENLQRMVILCDDALRHVLSFLDPATIAGRVTLLRLLLTSRRLFSLAGPSLWSVYGSRKPTDALATETMALSLLSNNDRDRDLADRRYALYLTSLRSFDSSVCSEHVRAHLPRRLDRAVLWEWDGDDVVDFIRARAWRGLRLTCVGRVPTSWDAWGALGAVELVVSLEDDGIVALIEALPALWELRVCAYGEAMTTRTLDAIAGYHGQCRGRLRGLSLVNVAAGDLGALGKCAGLEKLEVDFWVARDLRCSMMEFVSVNQCTLMDLSIEGFCFTAEMVAKLQGLRKLKLISCGLSKWPTGVGDGISSLKRLTSLDISGDGLTIPALDISRFQTLKLESVVVGQIKMSTPLVLEELQFKEDVKIQDDDEKALSNALRLK